MDIVLIHNLLEYQDIYKTWPHADEDGIRHATGPVNGLVNAVHSAKSKKGLRET